MARVTTVKKARKDQPSPCVRCHKAITAGQGYRWVANRIGRMSSTKRIHVECGSFKRSETTFSDKLGRLYDAQDDAHTEIDNWPNDGEPSALEDVLKTTADTADEVAEEYQASLDNMPEGLQQGDTGQQIQEKVDACESWSQELQSVDFEEFDEQAAIDTAVEEIQEPDEDTKARLVAEQVDERRAEWADEQRDAARAAVDSLEL